MKQKIFLLCIFLGTLFPGLSVFSSDCTYFIPLTDYDKNNIRYIIKTLSEHSAVGLLFYKNSLNEVGQRTKDVHPLKFLLFTFSDHELKVAVKKIQGLPWNRFMKGMGESLQSAKNQDDLDIEAVQDFSDQLGVPKEQVTELLRKKRWADFMNLVRKSI